MNLTFRIAASAEPAESAGGERQLVHQRLAEIDRALLPVQPCLRSSPYLRPMQFA